MCPVCLTTAALVVCGVVSTGGLAAIAISKFGAKGAADNNPRQPQPKEDHHG